MRPRSGPAGPGDRRRQGPGAGLGGPRRGGAVRPAHAGAGGHERRALVVLRRPSRPLPGPGAAIGRPRWRGALADPGRARDRLRRAPVQHRRRTRPRAPRQWPGADPRPRHRRQQRPPADRGRPAVERRLRGHAVRAHPARGLVQALGQHDDEPDLGAHRRHLRPHPRRPAGARLLQRRDAGGAGHRRRLRHPDRAAARRAPRRDAQARRLQDLDAAGRSRPAGRWRSTPCWAPCARSAATSASPRRTSTPCSAWCA